MIPLTSTSAVLLPTSPKSLRSSLLPALLPLYRARLRKKLNLRRLRNGTCRAEFANDAPIAVAIGACIFSSLVFPTTYTEDDDGDSAIDSADARFAVMGIISFIPYFNWMSWVFAWLDTGKQRYAVYALVYLAPYLRSWKMKDPCNIDDKIGLLCAPFLSACANTFIALYSLFQEWLLILLDLHDKLPVLLRLTNLSLSPEDSWLPIASILLCIFHIQLEVSIKNGDFQALNKFTGTGEELSSVSRKKDDSISEEEETNDHKNLPSAQEESRDEIRRWEISRRPSGNPEDLNEDEEDLSGRKH